MDRLTLIESLRERAEQAVGRLLGSRPRVALLDFPDHSNVGDSAIWLGELALLRRVGMVGPCYVCDEHTYNVHQLRTRLGGDGIILLSGGGNLGDLWPRHQRFRERVIADFADVPVVQLPQSIHFRSRRALDTARRVFDAHSNLTLLVRDARSLEVARDAFAAPSALAPDLAFCLGPLGRLGEPAVPVLWLRRGDRESRGVASPGSSLDWLDEPATAARSLSRVFGRHPWLARALPGLVASTYTALARERLWRGCRLLSRGATVVTDRLHGHILSVLLGIPHVVLDNSYGKTRSFYETWTAACPLANWAESPTEALELATGLAGAVG